MGTIQITKANDSKEKKDKKIKTITILLLIFFVIFWETNLVTDRVFRFPPWDLQSRNKDWKL